MPWDPGPNGWWNGAIVHVLAGSLRNTCLTGVSHEDAHKLQYAVDAAAWMENPFENKNVLDTPLFKALLWQAGKSAKEIMDHREAMVSQIELAAEELQLSGLRLQGALQMLVPPCAQTGKNDAWLEGVDAITYSISKGVSGFLLQELVAASAHCDENVSELFRDGLSLQIWRESANASRPRCADAGPPHLQWGWHGFLAGGKQRCAAASKVPRIQQQSSAGTVARGHVPTDL